MLINMAGVMLFLVYGNLKAISWMILHFLINKTDLRSNLTIAASFYCSTVHNIFLWRRVVECISLCFLSTRKSVELINIYFVHCSAEYDMIKYAYHVHPGTSSRYYLCTEEPSRSSPSYRAVLLNIFFHRRDTVWKLTPTEVVPFM